MHYLLFLSWGCHPAKVILISQQVPMEKHYCTIRSLIKIEDGGPYGALDIAGKRYALAVEQVNTAVSVRFLVHLVSQARSNMSHM